jgi:hypothetical protein
MNININEKISADVFGMTRTGTVTKIDVYNKIGFVSITVEWDWAPPNYDAYRGIYRVEELKDIIIK